MKRFVCVVAAAGLLLAGGQAKASWGSLSYSGYQPCWNIFAKRYKCLTPEEARLQKFWHDYYSALSCYYCSLDHIDWVAYYKNHGYQINACCGGGPGGCCGRINYAPVFVSPMMQWAVPPQGLQGPPCLPPGGPMPGGFPGGPGGPPGPGCMGPGCMGPGGM
jgi:hypothetical protein